MCFFIGMNYKRMKNRVLLSILTVCILAVGLIRSTICCGEENTLMLYAKAAVLMDADTGRVLYGKNESVKLPMASTTKIMTCILALEYGNPEAVVTISDRAARMPKVKLGVQEGEQYVLEDLLYSLMLESHNDSAVAIAEAVAGGVEEFAVMMNRKARDIGCYDTCFITPNGLDAQIPESGKEHSTTAADLAKIMAYCINKSPAKDDFLRITRTSAYTFLDLTGKRSFSCVNHNAFLSMMPEALSGKTGFTSKAGYCYVGAVRSEGRTYTMALLASGWPGHKNYKWYDMKTLATYGMTHYEIRNIYKEYSPQRIIVENGYRGDVSLFDPISIQARIVEENDKNIPYLLSEQDKVETKIHIMDTIQAPVKKGMRVGAVEYFLNGKLIKSSPIIAEEEINRIKLLDFVAFVIKKYLMQ